MEFKRSRSSDYNENCSWSVWFLWFYLLLVLLFIEKKNYSLIFSLIWTFFSKRWRGSLKVFFFFALGENVDKWILSKKNQVIFHFFFFVSELTWHVVKNVRIKRDERWKKIARKFIINWNFSSWSVWEVINHLISMSNVSLLSFLILNISIFHLSPQILNCIFHIMKLSTQTNFHSWKGDCKMRKILFWTKKSKVKRRKMKSHKFSLPGKNVECVLCV